MAGRNEALFKPFLFGDQELDDLVRELNPPKGVLAEAAEQLRAGKPGEAEVVLTAVMLTRPRELGPWHRLLLAAAQDRKGNVASAERALRGLLDTTTETRLRLWAWTALRRLGAACGGPPEGVVVEVDGGRGVETMGVYADGTARYLLASGARFLWDKPDGRLDAPIAAVINAAAALALPAGRLPGEPAVNTARVTVLAPAGLSAAEAPLAEAATAPMAPIYAAATALLEKILEIAKW